MIYTKPSGQEETEVGVNALAGASAVTAAATKPLVMDAELRKLDTTNYFTNISLLLWSLSKFYFLNPREIQPAAVLGGVPVPSVDELSHGISNRIAKYRATGGIFLAHQPGGDQTLRIVCKAYGKNRYRFLQMLDFLFLYGGARKVDTFEEYMQGLFANPQLSFSEGGIELGTDIEDAINIADNIEEGQTISPWESFENDLTGRGVSEAHLTFPVVTRNRVYSNMYIETYEYTEAIEHGMDALEYTIFFRKYLPDLPRQYVMVGRENKDPRYKKSIWFREDVNDANRRRVKHLNMIMDIGLSFGLVMYRFTQLTNNNALSWEENIAMDFGTQLNSTVDNNIALKAIGGGLIAAGAAATYAGMAGLSSKVYDYYNTALGSIQQAGVSNI